MSRNSRPLPPGAEWNRVGSPGFLRTRTSDDVPVRWTTACANVSETGNTQLAELKTRRANRRLRRDIRPFFGFKPVNAVLCSETTNGTPVAAENRGRWRAAA